MGRCRENLSQSRSCTPQPQPLARREVNEANEEEWIKTKPMPGTEAELLFLGPVGKLSANHRCCQYRWTLPRVQTTAVPTGDMHRTMSQAVLSRQIDNLQEVEFYR